MDEIQLAAELRRMYDGAKRNEAACQVHLFGIRYAEELQQDQIKRILKLSGLSSGYLSEISKGIKLAQYVTLREGGESDG